MAELEDELLLGLELALPLGLALEPDAALPDGLLELAPPLAWSFFESEDIEPEAALDAEPEGDALDDGDDGEVVEPADDEDDPDGAVVLPEGAVVVLRFAPGLSARSQPAIKAVPRARETAAAIAVSLMGPPWLGYGCKAARFRPASLEMSLFPAALEVPVLLRLLGVDLALHRVAAFGLLGGVRRAEVGRRLARRRLGVRGVRRGGAAAGAGRAVGAAVARGEGSKGQCQYDGRGFHKSLMS